MHTETLIQDQVRQVKRNDQGKAGPHRYAQAWSLTTTDAIGRFLGVNIGTPLQKKLSRLAVLLFCIAVVCAIIVLAANNFSNEQEVIIYAVATGLSMIPASLIVVLTITMAAGTKRMVERHVIVRNLKSLEALGAVTDICSDKTGMSYGNESAGPHESALPCSQHFTGLHIRTFGRQRWTTLTQS